MKRIYFTKEETKITKTKGYIEIDDEYYQLYRSIFNITSSLKSITDLQLMLYIAQESTKYNVISSSLNLYNSFNAELKDKFDKSITRQTFQSCINNLVNSKILVRLNKGNYQLNPIYIWKDTVKNRDEHILEIMQTDKKPEYISNY